jgi:hypothetical protein
MATQRRYQKKRERMERELKVDVYVVRGPGEIHMFPNSIAVVQEPVTINDTPMRLGQFIRFTSGSDIALIDVGVKYVGKSEAGMINRLSGGMMGVNNW